MWPRATIVESRPSAATCFVQSILKVSVGIRHAPMRVVSPLARRTAGMATDPPTEEPCTEVLRGMELDLWFMEHTASRESENDEKRGKTRHPDSSRVA